MSTINANTSGIIETADNTNTLVLQTNSANAVSIDSSQNATFAGTVIATKVNGGTSSSLTLQSNGTTAQTIDTNQNTTFAGSVNAPNTFGFKNRIINGAMMIDQRNNGASVTATNAGLYTVDRWQSYNSVASSKFTVQQTPSSTETGYATRVGAGFTNYLACTSSSSYSIASADYFVIYQKIEGFNFADMAWGTANAKTITLSFWAYSSLTGTFGGSLQNNAQNRNYVFSYSIPVANTWTYITATIQGDTSGTWLTNNGIGAQVFFSLGAGSSAVGSAGSWGGTAAFGVTGQTNVVATNGATFYITGVQLEKGSTATSFDYRPYGTELSLCQRYYWRNGSPASGSYYMPTVYGINTSTGNMSGGYPFPVRMRVKPSFSFGGSNPSLFNGTWSTTILDQAGTDNCILSIQGSLMVSGAANRLIGASDGTYWNDFNSEL